MNPQLPSIWLQQWSAFCYFFNYTFTYSSSIMWLLLWQFDVKFIPLKCRNIIYVILKNIYIYNYHPNQDTEHLNYYEEFPHTPMQPFLPTSFPKEPPIGF